MRNAYLSARERQQPSVQQQLGVDLRAARNRALADLVTTIALSLVADALGYSYQTVFNHAANAGDNWARYVGLS